MLIYLKNIQDGLVSTGQVLCFYYATSLLAGKVLRHILCRDQGLFIFVDSFVFLPSSLLSDDSNSVALHRMAEHLRTLKKHTHTN